MKITHSVDAKHMKNIGEQSVSSLVQAIIELVKNSHDADAKLCTIHFYSEKSLELSNINKIVIEDDGHGMTMEEIRDKWMRIGTKSKEEVTLSRYFKRRVSGAKGMGHFACQKLGNKIKLTSNPLVSKRIPTERPDDIMTLTINWADYEDGLDLTKIQNELTFSKKEDKKTSGISIEITDLKDRWTLELVKDIQMKLGNLLPPNLFNEREEDEEEKKKAFKIEVKCHGFESPLDTIESNIDKYAPWEIQGSLRESNIHYKILHKEKHDKKRKIVGDLETNSGRGHFPIRSEREIGNVDFKMYYFQDRPGDWTDDKIRDASTLKDQLRDNCGIKIYSDKVRIMPYGSPGNDWLGLGPRKIKRFGRHFRNENVIGIVKLSKDDNKGIKETTTRERLEENEDYYIMKDNFVMELINKLEAYVEEHKNEKDDKKPKQTPAKMSSDVKQIIDFIDSMDVENPSKAFIVQKGELKKQVQEFGREGIVQAKDTEVVVGKLVENIELYRNLASLGISALTFHHELTGAIARVNQRVNRVIDKWDEYDDLKKIDYLTKTSLDIDVIISLNAYIKEFAALFKGTKGSARKREQIDIETTIKGMKLGFDAIFSDAGIRFEYIVGPGCETGIWMNQASFESIILNLLTNSYRALTEVPREQKIIKATFEKSASHLSIRFFDNGHGINEHDFMKVFEPLYTTYKGVEKSGTGMGCTLMQEIIKGDYDGDIAVEKSVEELTHPGKGETTFVIRIPLSSMKKEDT